MTSSDNALAAFRFFRLLLRQNNANMTTQVLKHDIIKPILDLTIQESRRDNLLSCSCQEYFEVIRRVSVTMKLSSAYLIVRPHPQDNMKDIIKHCMTKHEPLMKTLAESHLGGQRFQLFIRRWEMNNEPLPVEADTEKYALLVLASLI